MVAMVETEAPATQPEKRLIPPLQFGNRLTRAEFHRRYQAMPQLKKAELIEGAVFIPSLVSYQKHGKPHGFIMTCLGIYAAATPGLEFADNATVILDTENEVQLDALLRKQHGASRINADGYLEGAPELIVEIAASTVSYDLHDKFRVYRRAQVQEYIVWRVLDDAIDWFYLDEDAYRRLSPNSAGVIQSQVFPGFHLALPSLLADNLAAVLQALQLGIESTAHRAFVEQLANPAT